LILLLIIDIFIIIPLIAIDWHISHWCHLLRHWLLADRHYIAL
jgi:hypothetical protein